MTAQNATDIGKELLDVPFPDMIKNMGVGIAEAQFELDLVSTRIAQLMSGADYEVDTTDDDGKPIVKKMKGMKVKFDNQELSLFELGFTPNFYQFVDTIIEIKMSVKMTSSSEKKQSRSNTNLTARVGLGWFSAKSSVSVSSVSASYASKYQYSAEGSSLMRTKLVPIPPPSVLEDRIKRIIEKLN